VRAVLDSEPMGLTDDQLEFLRDHRGAAMITIGEEGMPKAVRVGIALVEGEIWSSGRRDRVRTERLRRDPRCTLFVFDPAYAYLTLETSVTILEGPDAPEQSVQLFRAMQDKPTGPLSWYGEELSEEDFRRTMVDEGRLIYRFDVQRAYGLH
jgi:PPOX class probable F420-dependent enzyme